MTKSSILVVVIFLCLFLSCPVRSLRCQELDVSAYADKYRAWDQQTNQGRGYCTSRDSGDLAWAESYILNDYFMLYRVTGDTFWLDKMVQHMDMMMASLGAGIAPLEFRSYRDDEMEKVAKNLAAACRAVDFGKKDASGYPLWHESYPGWSTSRYSAALVKITKTESKLAGLVPDPEHITDLERARQVTGHDYKIYFGDEIHYGVGDLTASCMIEKWKEFKFGEPIHVIPGVLLKVEWAPAPRDTFFVKTIQARPLQYVAHDGMALYPVSRFIEAVTRDSVLSGRYGKKCAVYRQIIEEVFSKKWDRYFVEYGNGAGTWKSTESPAELTPNWLLPVNQNNALARAFLIMQGLGGGSDALYGEKARRVTSYFRNYLKRRGAAWDWSYWECGDPGMQYFSEDASHGSTDVGLAIEACHRHCIFSADDMQGFVHTLLECMWNGSLEEPTFGDRVDSRAGGANLFHGRHWFELCEFEPFVWKISLAWFKRRGEPAELIPSMLYAQDIYLRGAKKQ
jgi:hypothetical protein